MEAKEDMRKSITTTNRKTQFADRSQFNKSKVNHIQVYVLIICLKLQLEKIKRKTFCTTDHIHYKWKGAAQLLSDKIKQFLLTELNVGCENIWWIVAQN